jgi:2-aminomuconate deaminase
MSDGPIVSGRAAEPVGPYPHARRVGDLLFLSGIGPRERGMTAIPGVTQDATGAVVARDFEVQARAVFANVRAVIDAAGASWDDIVDVTVFLTHMADDFATLNRIWAAQFPTEATRPCRTTVEVTSLPTPIDIELKVVVHSDDSEVLQYEPIRRWAAASRVGRVVYLAGETGTDPVTMDVVQGGIDAQTEQVFANIRTTLARFGADLGDVVKVTVLLTDMADLPAVSAIRARVFPMPVPSTAMQVIALASPEMRVEIEAIARLPGADQGR